MSIEFKIEQQKLSQLRVIVWNSYIRKLLIGILEIRPTILIPLVSEMTLPHILEEVIVKV